MKRSSGNWEFEGAPQQAPMLRTALGLGGGEFVGSGWDLIALYRGFAYLVLSLYPVDPPTWRISALS